ncbi:MAG: Tic20 family protein [Prochlorococcaceae cyanobacterium]|jgi:hypothetical protein
MSPWLRPLAALAYLLPWADAVGFGAALFRVIPSLEWLALPTLPVVLIERGIPFGGFILFLVLFLAVVRNARVPQLVRFHVLQAILLDILLIVIGLAFQVLLRPLGDSVVVRTLANTVFLASLLAVLYGVIEALRGREGDLPGLSQAVRMQL